MENKTVVYIGKIKINAEFNVNENAFFIALPVVKGHI